MTVKAVQTAWLCLILLAPCLARAGDARLPYLALCRMQQAQIELSRTHTNLALVLQMRSTNADVKDGDILVAIHAKSGDIPIPIGPGGVFTVPVRDDLLAEDPWILVNQPKGTMELKWYAGLAPALTRRMTNAVHYASIMRAILECNDIQDAMRPFFPAAPRLTPVGLRLTFRSTAIAPAATIHAKAGDRRMPAGILGELIIPFDADWMREDPLITWTDPPIAVEIAMRQTAPAP